MRQRTDTNPVHSLAHSAADILLFMRPAAQTQPPIRKTFPNSLSRSMSFPWPHYALHTGLRWWCRPAGPTQPTTWDALTSPRDRSYHGAHTHPGINGTHAIVHGPRACTPSKCSARSPTRPFLQRCSTIPRYDPRLAGHGTCFSASLPLGAHKQHIAALLSSCTHWPLAVPPSTPHSWIRPACGVHSLGLVLPTHFRRRGTPCWASSGHCSILQQQ